MPFQLTPSSAQRFADSWYAAWNSHDLAAIMSHYAANIEHSSPFISRYHTPGSGPPPASLKGADAVRAYFDRALKANPALRFAPQHLALGLESVILVYRRHNNDLAAEIFMLNDEGLVVRSISHYAPR